MAATTETPSFAALLGVRGKVIHWGSLFSFFAALLISDLGLFFIQGLIHGGLRRFELPPGFLWVQAVVSAVLLTACAGVAFRLLKNGLAASAAAALGYVLLMFPVRLLVDRLGGHLNFGQIQPVLAGFSFAWNFLFLGGLVFFVRTTRPLWAALALGAAAGPLLVQLPRSFAYSRLFDYPLSVQAELFNAGFTLVSAALFAGVLWGLHDLAGVVAQDAAAQRPAAAPTPASHRTTPAPPPLPAAADSTIEIDRARLPLFHSINEFVAEVAARRSAVLRIRLADYAETYQEFVGFAGASATPRLLCAGCKKQFPGSFTLRLVAPDVFSGAVVMGASAVGEQFAQSLRCPGCGSAEAFFVFDTPAADDISARDLNVLRAFWRHRAQEWWPAQARSQAICDSCNSSVARPEGFLVGSSLYCPACCDNTLGPNALSKLKQNPDYFGSGELQRARAFARRS